MPSVHFKILLFVLATTSKYDDERVAVETPPTDLNCSLCLYLLDRPKRLTQCGHTFCHACIGHWFCIYIKCPLCRFPSSLGEIAEPSKEITSSLNKLRIKCKFINCCYNGHIKDIESHQSHCPFNPDTFPPTHSMLVPNNQLNEINVNNINVNNDTADDSSTISNSCCSSFFVCFISKTF